MKKLMIALAAVAMGVAANAATCYWNFGTSGDTYNLDQVTKVSGSTLYIFTAAVVQDDVLTALRDGGSLADLPYLTSGAMTDGRITKISGITTDESSTSGKSEFWAAVQVGDNVLISDGIKGSRTELSSGANINFDFEWLADPDEGQKVAYGLDVTHSDMGEGWYSTVPEPTSGLLLLLGVAGLALRRRRA